MWKKYYSILERNAFSLGLLRIRETVPAAARPPGSAVVDEDDAVGHLTGEAHFMGDHQHGDAGVGQLFISSSTSPPFRGRGRGGLVEQDHVRIHGKGTAMQYAAAGRRKGSWG